MEAKEDARTFDVASARARRRFAGIATGLSLIVSLLLAEALCSVFLPLPLVTRDFLGLQTRVGAPPHVIRIGRCWAFEPGTSGSERVRHSYDYSFRMNSLGLRNRETGEKASATTRVLVLGDSQTFGVGVDASETFPSVMQARLDARSPGRWEVINGGVYGYNTFDERCLFETLASILRPDVVIVTVFVDNTIAPDAGNDLAQNFAVIQARKALGGRTEASAASPPRQMKIPFLTRHSHLYNHLAVVKQRWAATHAEETDAQRADRRTTWDETREQLGMIAGLARGVNPRARTIVAYLPGTRSLLSNDLSSLDELKSSRLPVVSLADPLRLLLTGGPRSLTFELDGHYTGRVQRAVGERLASELAGTGVTDGR